MITFALEKKAYFSSMLLKTIPYPFGEAKYYPSFIHVKFREDLDVVELEYSKQIFKDIEAFYDGAKYVVISERGLNTSFDPINMKSLNLSKMQGLAVVSPEGAARRDELIVEQGYYKGSFAFFTTYKAAEEWALTFE